MNIILLERVEKLGQMGDLVNVRDGYARNFLLPKGKAMRATEDNKKHFETRKVELEAHNLKQKGEAEAVATKLDGESFVLIRQAGESGQLFGSVNARDIAEALTEKGFSVNRNQIILDRPVKVLGLVDQRVRLHPEVISTVTINVARSEEEAERQARGENVLATAEEREAALEIEEVFEEDLVAEIAEELAATEAEEALEPVPEPVPAPKPVEEAVEDDASEGSSEGTSEDNGEEEEEDKTED